MHCRSAIPRTIALAIALVIVVVGPLVFVLPQPSAAVASSDPSSENRQDHSRLTTARPHGITKQHVVPQLELTPAEIAGFLDGIATGAPGGMLTVDCSGGADFETIQAAIDAAQDGDTIVVLPNNCNEQGHYFENLLLYEQKSITVQSLMPENPEMVDATVVNGDQKDRVVGISTHGEYEVVLDGLTFTNGRGGINCSSDSALVIRNCNITANTGANTGGGVIIDEGGNPKGAIPLILNCRITYNTAGLVNARAASSALLTSGYGGGIRAGGRTIIRNCVIANNSASSQGGGIDLFRGATIQNCQITGNTAAKRGAGIYSRNHALTGVLVENCTIVGNTCTNPITWGGGIYVLSLDELTTIIRNSILWDNSAVNGSEVFYQRASSSDIPAAISYSDVQGGQTSLAGAALVWGSGNMIVDPRFVDPKAGDYRLGPNSLCIDAGDPDTELDPADLDIEGEPRLQYCRIDIGADESADAFDCDDNGVADACEIQDGSANDKNGNGRVDECETELYVDCNNCPGPGNGSIDDPYCSVQAAIDASWHGDQVILMPSSDCENGAYLENINFWGRDITVRSSQPDNPDVVADTIIDGSAGDTSVVVLQSFEGPNAVLDGLTITGGSGYSVDLFEDNIDKPIRAGGGVYCENAGPVIRRCTVSGNQAVYGGGIMALRSEVRIEDCQVFANLVIAQPEPGHFWGGYAATGGGIHLRGGEPAVQRCLISGNIALAGHPDLPEFQGTAAGAGVILTTSDAEGGGEEPITAMISNCEIRDNHIFVTNSSFNWAIGGGLTAFLRKESHLDLINCKMHNNSAPSSGGIYIQDGPALLRGCTIAGNSADEGETGGLELASNGSTIVGCIVYYNSSADFDNSYNPSEISFSNIGTDDGLPVEGPGNINEDPLFIDLLAGNYHLLPVSPCRNTGDPEYVPDSEEVDMDGDPRLMEKRVDMGADEFDPDCNANQIPDDQDILDETSQDCNANGIPDECDHLDYDCNANGVPDDCDITDGTSEDCDANLIPDDCEPDCNDNGVVDACDVDGGGSEDCNANGMPDECEPDCNDNGIADECDITEGVSGDCNNNAVPDECDITAGTSIDCNGNGIPDECDLVSPFISVSPQFSPFGSGFTAIYTIFDPPPAVDTVTITMVVSADLDSAEERVSVTINNIFLDYFFEENALDCPGSPDIEIILLAPEVFNAFAEKGEFKIRMNPLSDVDPNQCNPPSFIQVTIEYASAPFDCNGNGILDACDPDCNVNGVPDDCDLADGTSSDCNENAVPDECDPDADDDGVTDDCDNCELFNPDQADCQPNGIGDVCDLDSGASEDCNANDTPDECDLASGESQDCQPNDVPDECDLAGGMSQDCNENTIPDECETDCNANGQDDACDIEQGLSEDCNVNAIPDECEPDCNDSGQPDDCDVADGSSEDCNVDGQPDECVDPLPIMEQPEDQQVEVGELASFSVVVGGVLPEYQWRKDHVELADSERIFGSQNSLLIILDVVPEDAGEYDCAISSVVDCYAISDPATLTVTAACLVDLNGDGVVGPVDLAMLLAAWGPCPDPDACPADLNADDVVGPFDLATLLAAWGECS